jgi:23S rRNA pseudouridine955/2504/2580 synthase
MSADGGDNGLTNASQHSQFIQTFLGLVDYMPVFGMRESAGLIAPAVRWVEVTDAHEGQRLDNFLIRLCKGVPKSHLYKAVRAGEVRVNKGRCSVEYRLKVGDIVRVPPLRVPAQTTNRVVPKTFAVVYEDQGLLVIDKPAGVAVHGGSGISQGVIEATRAARPELRFLELVHRLDRDTSGLLMLAKRRSTLVALHEMLRNGQIEKHYGAVVQGRVLNDRQHIRLSLTKWTTVSGERRVRVDEFGQEAHTILSCEQRGARASWVDAQLKTGRTHQIRVHMLAIGHPIVGDEKYGSDQTQAWLKEKGLNRMYLHAKTLQFVNPTSGELLALQAPLPKSFEQVFEALNRS